MAAKPAKEKSCSLHELDFFKGLAEQELHELEERSSCRSFAAGEVLFYEKQPLAAKLRFVCSGQLQIHKSAASGKETIVRLIRPGEVFAVAALFEQHLAPATVTATVETVVLEIPLEDFQTHLTRYPLMAIKLLAAFAQRLKDLQETLHTVASERARTRLAALILRTLDRGGGTPVNGGIRLSTRLPHAVMSRMIGITYEECVRLIRDWSHDSIVLTYQRGGIITIRDREALERELISG
ncbi:Global nitrogen regulator [compost metagenome]